MRCRHSEERERTELGISRKCADFFFPSLLWRNIDVLCCNFDALACTEIQLFNDFKIILHALCNQFCFEVLHFLIFSTEEI